MRKMDGTIKVRVENGVYEFCGRLFFFPPSRCCASFFFLRSSGAEMPHCLVPRAGTCDLTTMSGNQISFPFPLYLKKCSHFPFFFFLGKKVRRSPGFPPLFFPFFEDTRRCGLKDKSESPLLDFEGEPAHNYARPEREWKGVIFFFFFKKLLSGATSCRPPGGCRQPDPPV